MVHRDQFVSYHLPTKPVFYFAQSTTNEHFNILVMHGGVFVVCLLLPSKLMLQIELSERDSTHDFLN